jgi:hypothetical protein
MRTEAGAKGCSSLGQRLRDRRYEVEQAVLARIAAVAPPPVEPDAEYVLGAPRAVAASIQYAVEALETGAEGAPPLPGEILMQARAAARNGIPLDYILRRCLAGHGTLGGFLIEEAQKLRALRSKELNRLLHEQSVLFDRLLEAVGAEYRAEQERLERSSHAERLDRIKGLLSGETTDTSGLAYDFDGCHLGCIAKGPGALRALDKLEVRLGRPLLRTRVGSETVWAWIGAPSRMGRSLLDDALDEWPPEVALAVGEPAQGLPGWRLTHRQAAATLPLTREGEVARYGDVAVVASMVQDELLAASLREMYLAPLQTGRDEGKTLRETLRVYFATGRNGVCAAARLGVSRQTVANRLQMIEQRLDRPLETCAWELEAALRLEETRGGDPLTTVDPRPLEPH